MIAVSRSRDILRKRRLPAESLTEWLFRKRITSSSAPFDPEKTTIEKEYRGTIIEAIQELNPLYREVIVLRHWGGHTYKEIADIVGCPLRTAQSRARLAYRRLEKKLRDSDLLQFTEEKP